MHGQKVKVYYPGIQKMCVYCYGSGHIKRDCPNEKREWVDHIIKFMNDHPEIPDEGYGKWAEIAKKEYRRRGYRSFRPKSNDDQTKPGDDQTRPDDDQTSQPQPQQANKAQPERQTQIDEVSKALSELKTKERSFKEMKEKQKAEEMEIEKLRKMTEKKTTETGIEDELESDEGTSNETTVKSPQVIKSPPIAVKKTRGRKPTKK
jgi:hypothetical protein